MTDETTTPTKPGYKTTEFYLALAAKILGGCFAVGLIGDGTEIARLCGLAAVVLTSLGYTVNRTLVKTAAMLCLLALASQSTACTHAQRVTMSGEFKACAKADLGQLMPTGLTLAGDIAAKIKGNAPTLTADLDAAALAVGVDAVKCAAEAAIAVLTAPTGSGATTSEPLPGIAIAQEWIRTR